jgi:hypothetical protein
MPNLTSTVGVQCEGKEVNIPIQVKVDGFRISFLFLGRSRAQACRSTVQVPPLCSAENHKSEN